MTRESSLEYSSALALTVSNNSSLRSYASSLAESTTTKTSIGSRIKSVVSRKRSKSLISMSSAESQQQQQQQQQPTPPLAQTPIVHKMTRNKSLSSKLHALTTSSAHSNASTRDNSISSLSDCDIDFPVTPVSPLCRIEEDSAEKTGAFPGGNAMLQSVRYITASEKQRTQSATSLDSKSHVELSDKVLDDMADSIMDQVQNSIVEWTI